MFSENGFIAKNEYLVSFLVLLLTSAFAVALDSLLHSAISVLLVLQLGVVVVSLIAKRWMALGVAIVSSLVFNFFITDPRYTLHMNNTEDVVNLVVFISVALATSYLSSYIKEQKQQLLVANVRSNILLSVSHDLRTPLAAVMGALETLETYRDKLDQDEQNELLGSARSESLRLFRYIENILQATKLQHQGDELSLLKQPTSIDVLIDNVIFRLGAPCVSRVPQNMSPIITIQAALIEQALFNLIENAVTFSPDGERVEISLGETQQALLIFIQDNGPGIPVARRKEVFTAFSSFRQSASKDGGSGLGLSVARGIIRAHGGDIRILPTTQGCTMEVSLPKEEAH
ncbi:sensor histidine kinase [Pseudoalteromonas piscicida]|uniref:sensor histidine kinase n=1 Tax=Pseudoalteromonas piscicida TaxID=43662 RepID=UPI003094945B